jgi:hypothetical protein
MTFAGAAAATEIISVAGTAVVTGRLSSRPMRTTASCNRCVGQCLSGMQGNLPVQFLGCGGTVMCPRYPTGGGRRGGGREVAGGGASARASGVR